MDKWKHEMFLLSWSMNRLCHYLSLAVDGKVSLETMYIFIIAYIIKYTLIITTQRVCVPFKIRCRNTLPGHTCPWECIPYLSPFSLSVVHGRKVRLFTCKGVGNHRRYQQTDEAERFVPRLRPHGSSRPEYYH